MNSYGISAQRGCNERLNLADIVCSPYIWSVNGKNMKGKPVAVEFGYTKLSPALVQSETEHGFMHLYHTNYGISFLATVSRNTKYRTAHGLQINQEKLKGLECFRQYNLYRQPCGFSE
jgi:hypothetical protein